MDFKDEAYIIYVNSGCQDDTELGRLMRDFHCKNAGEIHSEVLSKRVMALTLAERGMSAADIADIVKVSVKLVQEWLGVWAW